MNIKSCNDKKCLHALLWGTAIGTIGLIVKWCLTEWEPEWGWLMLASYLSSSMLLDLLIVFLAVVVAVAFYCLTQEQNRRTETRCRRCGYILKGLSKPECPECGEVI